MWPSTLVHLNTWCLTPEKIFYQSVVACVWWVDVLKLKCRFTHAQFHRLVTTRHNGAFRWWGWHHLLTNEHSLVWLRIICGPEMCSHSHSYSGSRKRASARTGLSQLAPTDGAGGWCGEWQSISSNNSSTFSCAGSVCSLHHPHHILDTWSSIWCIQLMIMFRWFLDLLQGQSDTSWHNWF